MEEIWKDIKDYKGLYQVSNFGRVKKIGLARIKRFKNYPFLSFGITSNNYMHVVLIKNKKRKTIFVHRLVAEHFIENPSQFPSVHHIDHNKHNNHYLNLQWVTNSENIKFNYLTGGQIGKSNMKGKFGKDNPGSKKIKQLDLQGNLIKIHNGLSEAAREIKGSAGHICQCCKGYLNKHKGFKWSYL